MDHLDRLRAVFRASLGLAPDAAVDELGYRAIPQWDSLAHMSLVSAMEDEFDIMIDTDEVLDMSSFAKAAELLEKQGVTAAQAEPRVALVTGSARGIGRAVAARLARSGHRVIVHGRTSAPAAATAAELSAETGTEVGSVHGDVSSSEEVSAMMREIHRRHRRLDVLVVNAGVHAAAMLGTMHSQAVDRLFQVNAQGATHTLQAAVRLLRKGVRPSVVLVASVMGTRGVPGQAVYAATKAAVLGLTYAAAKELGPAGIRVNAVAPGYIQTDMLATLDDLARVTAIAATPLGRLGHADDVAATAAFLVSDDACFVTGQVIGVDGGIIL